MWSMNQGKVVSKAIEKEEVTIISDGFFKYHRDTAAYIIDANNNITSIIYAVYNKPGNKTDQSLY